MILVISLALGAPIHDVRAYDLQPELGETLERFEPVGPEAAGAVRWVSPPTRGVNGAWPDPLTADGWVGGVAEADLAPGPWILWMLVSTEATISVDGDVQYGASAPTWPFDLASSDPFPVFRPEETEWERRIAGRTAWRRVRVDVADQPVSLAVHDGAWFALVVAPWDRRTDGGALTRAADAARRSSWKARWPPESPPTASPGSLAVHQTLAVGAPWSSRRPADAMRAVAAPGERVQWTLWLEGGDAAATVEVSAALAEVEIFEIHWLDAAGPWPRERRPRPAFARPTAGDLRGGQGVPVGVVVRARAPRRSVDGTVTVRRGEATVQVPLSVDVVPVKLPEPLLHLGFFAAPPAGWLRERPAEAAAWIASQNAQMRAFGASAVSWRGIAPPGGGDEALAEAALCSWGAGPLLWWDMASLRGSAFPDDAAGAVPPATTAMFGAREALGARCGAEVYHFIYNEEGYKSVRAVGQGTALGAALHGAELRTAAAFAGRVDWPMAGAATLSLVHGRPLLDAGGLADLRARGADEIWSYNLPAGRSGPWLAWASGTSGLMQWQWTPDDGDPFDLVGPSERWSYVFPAPNGETWPSIALLEWAEGREDLRWIAWAEQRARRKDRTGRALRALLADVRDAFSGAWVAPSWDHEAAPATAWAATRDAIVRHARR